MTSIWYACLWPGGGLTPTLNQGLQKVDWDFYCGPAPLRPFCSRIHPGGWRNFLDFGNGTLGDWGVHWLDQLLWTEEKHQNMYIPVVVDLFEVRLF